MGYYDNYHYRLLASPCRSIVSHNIHYLLPSYRARRPLARSWLDLHRQPSPLPSPRWGEAPPGRLASLPSARLSADGRQRRRVRPRLPCSLRRSADATVPFLSRPPTPKIYCYTHLSTTPHKKRPATSRPFFTLSRSMPTPKRPPKEPRSCNPNQYS